MDKKRKFYGATTNGNAQLLTDLQSGNVLVVKNVATSQIGSNPVDISLIISNEDYNFGVNDGVRLSLDQTIQKLDDTNYLYRDALNFSHILTERLYYKDEVGTRIYNRSDGTPIKRSDVEIDYNKNLTYQGKAIIIEYKNDAGLTLKTTLDGFINSSKLELRADDIAQLEDTITQYQYNKDELEMRIKECEKIIENPKYDEMIDARKKYEEKSLNLEFSSIEDYQEAKIDRDAFIATRDSYYYNYRFVSAEIGGYKEKDYGVGIEQGDIEFSASETGQTYFEVYGRKADQIARLIQSKGIKKLSAADEVDQLKLAFYSTYTQDMMRKYSELIRIANEKYDNTVFRNQDKQQLDKQELLLLQQKYLDLQGDYETKQNNRQKEECAILIDKCQKQIEKYEKEINLLNNNLNRLNKQLPVLFLFDNNQILGFNSVGELSILFDRYDNMLVIERDEDNKIVQIIDTHSRSILLSYNTHKKLTQITDTNDDVVTLKYLGGKLQSICDSNDETVELEYFNNRIAGIIGIDKCGYRVEYNDQNPVKIIMVDNINNTTEELVSLEFLLNETISRSPNTVVQNHALFSNEGLIAEYIKKGEQIESISAFEYESDHCNFTISTDKLSNVVFFDQNTTFSGSKVFNINPQDLIKGTTDYLLSGLATAQSVPVKDNRQSEYCDHETEITSSDARFEIRCELEYSQKTKLFIHTFNDSIITKQFGCVPVTLDEDEYGVPIIPKSIRVIVDFSNNTGNMKIENLHLQTGSFTYNEFDQEYNNTYSSTNETIVPRLEKGIKKGYLVTKQSTANKYDNNNNLVLQTQKVITESYDLLHNLAYRNIDNYDTKFTYNKNNQLLTTISHFGLVTKNHYDEKGQLYKKTSYHISNPGLTSSEEVKLDELSRTLTSSDGGENLVEYKYDGVSTKVASIASNGIVTTLGIHGNTITTAVEVDGIANEVKKIYSNGNLIALNSNNTNYNFSYGRFNNLEKISINDNDYVRYYKESLDDCDFHKTLYNTNEGYASVIDKDGKLLRIDKIVGDKQIRYLEYSYDEYNNLVREYNHIENQSTIHEYVDKNVLAKTTTDEFIMLIDSESKFSNGISYEYNDGSITKYRYQCDNKGQIEKVELNGEMLEQLEYDNLGRIDKRTDGFSEHKYVYYTKNSNITNLVKEHYSKIGNDINIDKFSYDNYGNIIRTKSKNNECRYRYDKLNRLIREDNKKLNQTITIDYDYNGNIRSKELYFYSEDDSLVPQASHSYQYQGLISDYLIGFNDELIEYDSIGNPTKYRNHVLEWSNIKNLTSFDQIKFGYNKEGIRIKKEGGNKVTQYTVKRNKILKEKVFLNHTTLGYNQAIEYNSSISRDEYEIEYLYGTSGVLGFVLTRNQEKKKYFYLKNILGDIIKVYNEVNEVVAEYVYDAWGNHSCILADGTNIYNSASGVTAGYENHVGIINPWRYRGYYWDSETQLYYLPQRYYDPEIGRFINADSIENAMLQIDQINGLNLYAFCLNNPVNYSDPTGGFVLTTFLICLGVGLVVGAVLGGASAVHNGAELWSKDFWIGVGTGALIGGAVGAVAGLGGAFLVGGLSSIAGKAVADITSIALFGTSYGSFGDYLLGEWQNYGVAFAVGGLLKGLPLGKLGGLGTAIKFGGDVLARPALNQLATMGVKPGTSFNWQSYMYTVAIRAATFNISFGTYSTPMLGSEFSIGFGKAIMRGFLSGYGKKYIL